jgi:FkbM family methyltransferase
MRGVNTPYDQMVTFFRYFPFGKINLDQTVDITYQKKPVKFFFENLGPMIAGEFIQHDYDWLPVDGHHVIDIGAAYGDTAIIFCRRGAKKVMGYELNKRHFEIAKKNIALNNIEDKVELHYCGVASKKICNSDEILGAIIHDEDRHIVGDADFKTFDEIVALQQKSYGMVLKIDVDGYEYEILRSANNKSINQFKFIAMEYHFGVQDLVPILENSGFEVTVKPVTNVSIDYHPVAFQHMEIGMIYAKRIRILN